MRGRLRRSRGCRYTIGKYSERAGSTGQTSKSGSPAASVTSLTNGPSNASPGGYLLEIANMTGALIVNCENRWYGESMPGPLTDTQLEAKVRELAMPRLRWVGAMATPPTPVTRSASPAIHCRSQKSWQAPTRRPFSSAIWQPIIGGWIDNGRAEAAASGLQGDALELAAGQATLQNMLLFPIILIVLFIVLRLWMKRHQAARAETVVNI